MAPALFLQPRLVGRASVAGQGGQLGQRTGPTGAAAAPLRAGRPQLRGRPAPARRAPPPAAAAGAGEPVSSQEASATVERCLAHFTAQNLDAVIEHLPAAVVDRVLTGKRSKVITARSRDLSFTDLLGLAGEGDFRLDAYAQRGLILAPPAAVHMLSSLKVSPTEFLQRYAVTTSSGEEMVVTFKMALEDSLVFVRGVSFTKEWFLRGITGEPAAGELPTDPAPCWGPESVVRAQLEAFRVGDLEAVYRLASPLSHLLSGSFARFEAMMRGNALYRPLVGHREARVLQCAQKSRDKAWVIVEVKSEFDALDSSIPRRSVYYWSMRLTDARSPSCPNCWLTEGVQPFSTRVYNI